MHQTVRQFTEGVVHSWDEMEQVWEYVFTSLLEVSPQDHPVLLSEYASTPKEQREKCAEVIRQMRHIIESSKFALIHRHLTAAIVPWTTIWIRKASARFF